MQPHEKQPFGQRHKELVANWEDNMQAFKHGANAQVDNMRAIKRVREMPDDVQPTVVGEDALQEDPVTDANHCSENAKVASTGFVDS